MERQIITVDISPYRGMVPQLRVSQGDIGRPLGVYIMQDGAALDCSGYSADLYILKSDGNYYVTPVTVDNTETNLIIWSTEVQETPVAGECAGQIRIRHGEDDIGTARFVEYVEASPGFSGAGSESAVESIKEYVRQAAESAETASSAATSASTSATTATGAASSATSSATAAAGSASSAHTDAETASQAAQTAQNVADSIPEDYSTLSNDVTGLKSAFAQLDANVITESAGPSPIVSIADGADGMPMRKVEVAIEPVQDLHGYDAPWPAGGGKNLIPPIETTTHLGVTFTQDGDYINISGTPSGNAFCGLFDDVLPAGTYTLNGLEGASSQSYRTGLKIADATSWTYNSTAQRTFTLEAESQVQIALIAYPGYGTFNNVKVQYQLERGDTVTQWTPYFNICPISGWTGAKVTRTGKNLFDEVYTGIRQGSVVTYKPVFVGSGIFTLSSTTPNSGSGNSLFLLSGNVTTGASSGTNGVYAGRPITMPSVDGYVTIGYRNYQDIDPSEYKSQLEIGSVATNYEPYQGQTYEVTFPADPGTVYGGTLDVVSGKLVVDRKIIVLNGTETIAVIDNVVAIDGYSEFNSRGRAISSHYKSVVKGWNNLNFGEWQLVSFRVGFKDAHASDIATAQAYITEQYQNGTPIQFIGELRNKVVIQLTPQEIETLLGTNHVWSDAGNTAITYPADTKTYIDNRINSTRKLIAGIETGFVASKAYAVGDMLIIGDDLYKVASSIASGATITVGTNVTKTTVAEQLIALANA